jgi:acyl dehydratase
MPKEIAMKLEDLTGRVGEVLGTSDWMTLDQSRINTFADCTEDHQFIHVNPEMAKMTPFGGTIAHGMLTLSVVPALMNLAVEKPDVKMAVNYGFDKVRFLTPVHSGKRVRGVFKLLGLSEKRPGQWQQTIEATIEIEGGDKPALIAEWIVQYFV